MKLTFWPSRICPISASSTDASTCILVVSAAISNKLGVWKLAATVVPGSTSLLIMTPLAGATMTVRLRSSVADESSALPCRICAPPLWVCANATCNALRALFSLLCAMSRPAFETNPRSASAFCRAKSRSCISNSDRARDTLAKVC